MQLSDGSVEEIKADEAFSRLLEFPEFAELLQKISKEFSRQYRKNRLVLVV